MIVDRRPRCSECGRVLLVLAARPWVVQCSRCKFWNAANWVDVSPSSETSPA